MTARRLAKGMLAAVLTALWAILLVKLSPYAQALYLTMPSLAMTLGAAFVGLAFLIGSAPGRSDPAGRSLR